MTATGAAARRVAPERRAGPQATCFGRGAWRAGQPDGDAGQQACGTRPRSAWPRRPWCRKRTMNSERFDHGPPTQTLCDDRHSHRQSITLVQWTGHDTPRLDNFMMTRTLNGRTAECSNYYLLREIM